MKNEKTYTEAAHAMQSGVAMMMNIDPSETTPKHLRVGINSAMVETSTIVGLLIEKGIITSDEWKAALTKEMNAEVERYEKTLKDHGINAHLA